MNITKRYQLLTFLLLAFLISGCATKKDTSSSSPPVWVNQGSGAFDVSNNRVFYGVGAISGVNTKSLARNASENRARAEIAKTFETYTASLMEDYSASTVAGSSIDGSANVSEEQHVELAIKTFSAVTLNGVLIIDHWTDPADGTLYSLAKLNLDNFKNNLEKMSELNSKVKEYVKMNAEKSFDKLEAEENKR